MADATFMIYDKHINVTQFFLQFLRQINGAFKKKSSLFWDHELLVIYFASSPKVSI